MDFFDTYLSERVKHRACPMKLGKGERSLARLCTHHSAARCASCCLAFPEAEEFESHGTPNFRARKRKGRVFAMFALNHHGDGHVALWLNTPAVEQSRLIESAPKHIFKPQYVGPSGWIGVELNRGFSWKRVIELAHMAYVNSSPAKLVAQLTKPPAVAAPYGEDDAGGNRSPEGTEGAQAARIDS